MKARRIIPLLFCLSVARVFAQHDVTLAWNPSPDTNVVGYNLYIGSASRTYTRIENCGNVTNFTVTNLVSGERYYFTATAYTISGVESDYSNEVGYTVKPSPPFLKTPYVTLSWGGPYTIETSTNLLTWSYLMDTPFNTVSLPRPDAIRFYRISAGTNLNVTIEQSPQL